jgi:hypothetical protein
MEVRCQLDVAVPLTPKRKPHAPSDIRLDEPENQSGHYSGEEEKSSLR